MANLRKVILDEKDMPTKYVAFINPNYSQDESIKVGEWRGPFPKPNGLDFPEEKEPTKQVVIFIIYINEEIF